MWLDRFSGHNAPSGSPPQFTRSTSPAPGRSSLHLSRNPSHLRRPEFPQRVSSWSGLVNGSSESLPQGARVQQRSGLKEQINGYPSQTSGVLDVLNQILKTINQPEENKGDLAGTTESISEDTDVNFNGLSLQAFVSQESRQSTQGIQSGPHAVQDTASNRWPTVQNDRSGFEDLHKSIKACDEILVTVEKNLSVFQADLATVSAEIETLQNKSIELTERLQRRKDVEKKLGPEIDRLVLSPATVRKISDGPLDDSWAQALRDLEKASKLLNAKTVSERPVNAAEDVRPLLDNLKDRAVERIRDHLVAQIKALRSPSVNAQIIQKNGLGRFKDAYAFLARHQPKLEEEIAQAYINTIRWYYLSNFSRYKAALDKIRLYVIDKTDTLAQDDPMKRAAINNTARASQGPLDPFSLGRRIDTLRAANSEALSSFAAEEDRSVHFLEIPFRAFNLALIDNAASEFAFMTSFFSSASFHTVSKRFQSALEPTLNLGQSLTKQLIENSGDALGILLCVRLNQHFAFDLQRRKVSAMEGYINGASMLLWPRFQMVMDMHCDALKKAASSLSGKPTGLALSLTTASNSAASVAPHPITQRFANFSQGVLALSRDAGDDEPVHRSLVRLRDEFQVLLVKLSKSIADAKKRERFLINNYSLVGTIISETDGKMANDFKEFFAHLTGENR